MLNYIKKRIKELDEMEIEAQLNNDWDLAIKVNFAKCELMDCKAEYDRQQADKNLETLNKVRTCN